MFGSQATGLFLPTSDIDVVITIPEQDGTVSSNGGDKKEKGSDPSSVRKPGSNPETPGSVSKGQSEATTLQQEKKEMENWNVASTRSPLHRLAEALFANWRDSLTYLEVIENTRVPLVKFTVELDSDGDNNNSSNNSNGGNVTSVSFDVCFNRDNGTQAASLMKTYLQAMPPLRPLTFVLKYFLVSRGLNEPYSGGIGSYLLQLMIVSFLQHRARDGYVYNRNTPFNLGCLLLDFFELYGSDFNYYTTGISVRYDGFYFPKGDPKYKEHFITPGRAFLLSVENPLEPTVDVGKSSFKIQTIQRSMEVAQRLLLAHVTEPRIDAESILGSILPTTPEMSTRMRNPDGSSARRAIGKRQETASGRGGASGGVDDKALNPPRKRTRLQ